MRCERFFICIAVFGQLLLEIFAHKGYTAEWAVHVPEGEDRAMELARLYGFTFNGKIMPEYFSFRHSKVAKRSKFPSRFYHKTLADDPSVKWLEQQVVKSRKKRSITFTDPKWNRMWYLNRGRGLDMNVQKAWNMGITGKGVVVTILDDGIETDHPDLQKNYDEKASYDVNGHDTNPNPRYEFTNENRHGTRCAGEVAAQANNSECSVGVAYDAKIGGVRMLDGDVTDSVEAQSLSLNPQHIQIYSASWGPDDDGRTVDGPATLARKAFHDGIKMGRGGLGSIFVWASGNGGRDGDSCNCDGYTNSIHTLSISSVTENGNIPWYSEACSSTLATTYSSGSAGEKQIVTTDLRSGCTETHTGTSASAPLAAGLCALALQANPMLTWRDLQHIVVMTSKPDYLDDQGWVTNGVGRKVSHSFGYGLMDAGAMVKLARNWTTVPPQHVCEVSSVDEHRSVPMNGKISVPLYTDGCEGDEEYHVKYLEHVQARISLIASKRGEVQIYLTSPSGTTSTLLAKRARDVSREGFSNWAFMTTHNWGEQAKGQWVLVIENGPHSFRGARLKFWELVLYGTDRDPQVSATTTTSTTSTSSPATTTAKHIRTNRDKDTNYGSFYHNLNPNVNPPRRQNKQNRLNKPPRQKNKQNKSKNRSRPRNKARNEQKTRNRNPYFKAQTPKTHFRDKHRMCIFETLAKRNNMSTTQYIQMMQGNLTAAELKSWTLIVRGTASHPQMHNMTPAANDSEKPFMCSGITSHSVCIECRPGFYKLKNECVANCPEHFYGIMQMVQVRSTVNTTAARPKYQRHGVCRSCDEACRTCKGPAVTDCFQCADGYEKRDNMCQKKLLLNFLDPDMLGFFIWVIVLCIAAIVLFGVIFGLLQAKDRRLLCWREKGHMGKGEYNGMTLTREELESDLEHFDIIRNRNFQHANSPVDPESASPRTSVTETSNRASRQSSRMNSSERSSRFDSAERSTRFDSAEYSTRPKNVERSSRLNSSERSSRQTSLPERGEHSSRPVLSPSDRKSHVSCNIGRVSSSRH